MNIFLLFIYLFVNMNWLSSVDCDLNKLPLLSSDTIILISVLYKFRVDIFHFSQYLFDDYVFFIFIAQYMQNETEKCV